MGNCCSQSAQQDAPNPQPRRRQNHDARSLTIGPPQAVAIHIPRNRTDQYGTVIQPVTRDIDRDTLLAALQFVARYIAQRNQHITVVTVGGAVNTLYLKSRRKTHDVDIFGSNFTNQARVLLDEAMHNARRSYPDLGTDWVNTETQMWLHGPLHHQLTTDAEEQNIKVFEMPGLTIMAAPWAYAFSAKVNRLLTGGDQVRPYDLDDAVTYIHEYIRAHGNRPVQVKTALQWAKQFNHESTNSFLRSRVNKAYQRRYGSPAFI